MPGANALQRRNNRYCTSLQIDEKQIIEDMIQQYFALPQLRRIVFILLVALCCEPALPVIESSIGGVPQTAAYAASKKKRTVSKTTAKKRSRKKGKRRKRARRAVLPKPFLQDVTNDSTLAPGVKYSKMITGGGKYSLHVITVDYDEVDDDIKVEVLKGHERFNGLEKITDIAARRDSIGPDSVLGAVNANFWKAYYNTPINPTVVDGEVIEMQQNKQWTSAFFDKEGRVYMDRFAIAGTVRTKKGIEWPVESVNARHAETGVVVYNSFSGDTIPYIKPIAPDELSKEALDNFTISEYDSTESGPTLEAVLQAASEKKREGQIEYGMRKVSVVYQGNPRINERLRCVVMRIDTGTVIVPNNGAVLSFGRDVAQDDLPRHGDTLSLLFKTNIHDKVPFEFAVGGTPRLVRNGKAAQESAIEGSTARRFVSGNLSRTAIGVDKTNSVLYLVSVDGTHRANGTRGMTLAELAGIMRDIGAYNAMNLDGGGSVSMVVGGRNVVRIGGGEFNRKISTALGVVKKNARNVDRKASDGSTVKPTSKNNPAPGAATSITRLNTADTSQHLVQPSTPVLSEAEQREAFRQEKVRREQERARLEAERRREQARRQRQRR